MYPATTRASGERSRSQWGAKADTTPKQMLVAQMYAAYLQKTCRVSGRNFARSSPQRRIRGRAKLQSARPSCPAPARINRTFIEVLLVTYRHFYRERISKGSEIPTRAWPWAVLFVAC